MAQCAWSAAQKTWSERGTGPHGFQIRYPASGKDRRRCHAEGCEYRTNEGSAGVDAFAVGVGVGVADA